MSAPHVLLVASPSVNFGGFVERCHQVMGYSPASAADASPLILSESARFLHCLAAMRDKEARVSVAPPRAFLSHVSFSVFVVADERDLLDMLGCCVGMPFVKAETTVRGVMAAIITGTLAQWRDAVAAGCVRDAEQSVRIGFNKIRGLFSGENLDVWSDYRMREAPDGTLLLDR
jgi:hypothetical protein